MAEETDSPEEKSLELQDLEEAEAPAAEGDGKGEGGGDEPQTLGEAGGLPDIGDLPRSAKDLEAVYDIPVKVSAVLGKTTMQVSQLLKLGRGAVIELDRKVGEAIDIYVNNRLVARGEVVVVEDRLGVTMTEIIKTESSS
ncbi:MAG: flagellar motor switch protein FliN [Alphaproteobacteria bacterium]